MAVTSCIRDQTTRDYLVATGQVIPNENGAALALVPLDYKPCLKMDALGHYVAAIRIANNEARARKGEEPEVFFPTLPPDDWAWFMKDEDIHY